SSASASSGARVKEAAPRPAPVVGVPVARAEESRLAHALARHIFTVTVELMPPRGHHADVLVEQARQLRIHGVDFANIPDGPRASARMSALAASLVVQQQADR